MRRFVCLSQKKEGRLIRKGKRPSSTEADPVEFLNQSLPVVNTFFSWTIGTRFFGQSIRAKPQATKNAHKLSIERLPRVWPLRMRITLWNCALTWKSPARKSAALPKYGGFGCSMLHFIPQSARQRRARHWRPRRQFWITRRTSKSPHCRHPERWETTCSACGTPNQRRINKSWPRKQTRLRLWLCTTSKLFEAYSYPWCSSFSCANLKPYRHCLFGYQPLHERPGQLTITNANLHFSA